MGIIACVEVTTTLTTGTTPQSTAGTSVSTSSSPSVVVGLMETGSTPSSPISGTTTIPTGVQTTGVCTKDMAKYDGVYVLSVIYPREQPAVGTSNVDLINPTSNGINFPSVSTTNPILDEMTKPRYTMIVVFNPAGVNSLSSIIINNNDSNVQQFSVEFYVESPLNPTYPYISTLNNNNVLSLTSTMKTSEEAAKLVNFPQDQIPSPLTGIRISVLSTTDNL